MVGPAEVSIAALLKWLWVAVFVPVGVWFHNRIDNTYTKTETKEQIKMEVAPIITELKHIVESRRENTERVAELNDTMRELLVQLAKKQIRVYPNENK